MSDPRLNYEPRTPTRRMPPLEEITSLPLTLALALPTLVLFVLLFVAMPRVVELLKEFRVELPLFVQLSLRFSNWARDGGWMLLLLIPLLLPVLLTRLSFSRHRPVHIAGRMMWSLNFALLLSLLVIAWFALTFLLPMVSVMQSLSTPVK